MFLGQWFLNSNEKVKIIQNNLLTINNNILYSVIDAGFGTAYFHPSQALFITNNERTKDA